MILVTGHEEAATAETSAIKHLKIYARSQKKQSELKNIKPGGEGIARGKPYHFVYVFYTPKRVL